MFTPKCGKWSNPDNAAKIIGNFILLLKRVFELRGTETN